MRTGHLDCYRQKDAVTGQKKVAGSQPCGNDKNETRIGQLETMFSLKRTGRLSGVFIVLVDAEDISFDIGTIGEPGQTGNCHFGNHILSTGLDDFLNVVIHAGQAYGAYEGCHSYSINTVNSMEMSQPISWVSMRGNSGQNLI
jgi:hypothetical protein